MKQLKNLTILLCFLSLIAIISCSNEGATGSDSGGNGENNAGENGGSGNGSGEETISSSYVGDWYDAKDNIKVITVNSDGSITIDGVGNITNITKKSDTNFIMYYDTKSNNVSVRIEYDINFSSYNSGTIVVTSSATIGGAGGSTPPSETINIVKK